MDDVTATASPPRLVRDPGRGVLLGVAVAIADHIRVPVRWVRIAFVLLSAAAGLGVALYGAYYIVVPTAETARSRPNRLVEYALAGCVAVAGIVIVSTTLPRSGSVVPVMLAALGGALIWRQATDTERTRLRRLSRTSIAAGADDRIGRVRIAGGVALVVAGGITVLARADVTAVRDGLLAMVVTVVGVALITGPWWMRTVGQLGAEREARIRSQERADIAAHLHDSVLQTLALIQRNAGSPREVARLARGQERELRTLLYTSPTASGRFAAHLRDAAGDVEDSYAISVEAVVVGDAALDDQLAALAAATREALVNAAKHAGVDTVSVYAEVEPEQVTVFVKDRGAGFDPEAVADDRQGIRGSIVGRVERHGGSVRMTSRPGAGTEVQLTMPIKENLDNREARDERSREE